MKILDMAQVRELDAWTIEHEPVKSIDLMERACTAFVNWFVMRFDPTHRVGVVCGTGNNGGDGLGIARLLAGMDYAVTVWIVRGGKESDDFQVNFGRLQHRVKPVDFVAGTSLSGCEIIIDALFGSGLTRPAEGIYEEAIKAVNQAEATRIAVDIPSGMFADQHTTGAVVKSNFTVTFQLPKLAFLLPENQEYVGEWRRVDIGLDKTFIRNAETTRYYLTRKSVKKLLRPRKKFSHKGDYGRALLVSGSRGKMGAAVLASRGALRAGVGLLTTHVPKCGVLILQTAVPEAMVSVDPEEMQVTKVLNIELFDAIGVGPGIGQSAETVPALRDLLDAGKPMVLDADALNLLAAHRELLHLVPRGSILTPHPREFERLAGKWQNDFDRLAKQLALARQLKSIVIVKGAHSAVATPEGEIIFNCTGNPGMATGGTGDVLTGVLTGLLAQGHPAREAAMLGVYLHGLAGDIAAREKGLNGLVAGDLVDFLPSAYKTLE
ncbi:MAG: NAD(P)H-hydrate dehydratase [Cyclobacteriaceae bacterium]|nr:NAD(P)H-hydrate dehydratase [Cyclobacteriaceae bacterium]